MVTGQFVPVSSGMMRNTWFPARVARYPDFDERRAIKAGTIEVERNYEFDASARDAVIRKTEEAPVRPTGSIENAWKKYLGESIEEIKPQAVMEAAIEAAQIEVQVLAHLGRVHQLILLSQTEPSRY